MSSTIDHFTCPSCGNNACREQDNRTCEVYYSCSGCDWHGESVEDIGVKEYTKITTGFVVQNYKAVGDKYICTSQEFIAGDQVDYEDSDGKNIKIDTTKELSQPVDMVKAKPQATNGLIFTCPDCQDHRLECCEEGAYSSEITNIDNGGDFNYGKIDAYGDVDKFQCLTCGYTLELDDGYGLYSITENKDVIRWIKEN